MGALFLAMLNALRLTRPIQEVARVRVLEGPARSAAGLRHLEAARGVLKEDANTSLAMLIARYSDEDMIRKAGEPCRRFGEPEVQIAAAAEALA